MSFESTACSADVADEMITHCVMKPKKRLMIVTSTSAADSGSTSNGTKPVIMLAPQRKAWRYRVEKVCATSHSDGTHDDRGGPRARSAVGGTAYSSASSSVPRGSVSRSVAVALAARSSKSATSHHAVPARWHVRTRATKTLPRRRRPGLNMSDVEPRSSERFSIESIRIIRSSLKRRSSRSSVLRRITVSSAEPTSASSSHERGTTTRRR